MTTVPLRGPGTDGRRCANSTRTMGNAWTTYAMPAALVTAAAHSVRHVGAAPQDVAGVAKPFGFEAHPAGTYQGADAHSRRARLAHRSAT